MAAEYPTFVDKIIQLYNYAEVLPQLKSIFKTILRNLQKEPTLADKVI